MSEINLRRRSNRFGTGDGESSKKLYSPSSAQPWSIFFKFALTSHNCRKERKNAGLFLQANYDHDLTPNRVLSEEVRKAGQPVEAKVYPAFGSRLVDGHSFCVRGTETWGPDVLRFVETYLK